MFFCLKRKNKTIQANEDLRDSPPRLQLPALGRAGSCWAFTWQSQTRTKLRRSLEPPAGDRFTEGSRMVKAC